MRIEGSSTEDHPDVIDKEFNKEITAMRDELFEHSSKLANTINNDEFEKFDQMHSIFNVRLKESINILNVLYASEQRKCAGKILDIAKTSFTLIKDTSDNFTTTIQVRWKKLNDRMAETYCEGPLLEGMKKRKLMTSSLYLYLQADTVEALDMFWREYLDGTLKYKVLSSMYRKASNIDASISVIVAEDNYRRYRSFIGEWCSRSVLLITIF